MKLSPNAPLVRFACPAACLALGLVAPLRAQDSLADQYRDAAGRLLGAALVDIEGFAKLEYLTTHIGHRLSGSTSLEAAVAWTHESMGREGLATRLQPCMVPHWVRGAESVELLEPEQRSMAMLGLGGSVGTGPEGLRAEVVVVTSFDELESLGREAVQGKIVAYAVEWKGYGATVAYRSRGASRAAALGAVGVLVRSATDSSLNTPHTGALRYADDAAKIPAAALPPEETEWMLRQQLAGKKIVVRMNMEAETLPDAPSANVIAEIRGSELSDEVVVMGGHLDSWDVGTGAHDDGAACMAAWHALTLVQRAGLVPRRTLRVVLWTNEENGLAGGRAYREGLGDSAASHVAAIEMDGGCERPTGFGLSLAGRSTEGDDEGYERAFAMLADICSLFDAIDASEVQRGGGGADIGPLMRDGVPGLGFRTVGEHYFDWHHTRADTLDKVEPDHFRRAVGMLAVVGFVLADMPETLDPSTR